MILIFEKHVSTVNYVHCFLMLLCWPLSRFVQVKRGTEKSRGNIFMRSHAICGDRLTKNSYILYLETNEPAKKFSRRVHLFVIVTDSSFRTMKKELEIYAFETEFIQNEYGVIGPKYMRINLDGCWLSDRSPTILVFGAVSMRSCSDAPYAILINGCWRN